MKRFTGFAAAIIALFPITSFAGTAQKWDDLPKAVRETILANGGKKNQLVDREKGQKNGLATEEGGGYDNTEVLIARADGSDIRSVVPPHKGRAAVNSYWTPDGKGVLFASNRIANAIAMAGRKIACITREPMPNPACAAAPKSRMIQYTTPVKTAINPNSPPAGRPMDPETN